MIFQLYLSLLFNKKEKELRADEQECCFFNNHLEDYKDYNNRLVLGIVVVVVEVRRS
jgi:hypothetical protein